MTEILSQITEQYSIIFFIRQTIAIIILFLMGLFAVACIFSGKVQSDNTSNSKIEGNSGRISIPYLFLLAFPVGISIFTVTGIFLLSAGIKYAQITVIFVNVLVLALIWLSFKKENGKETIRFLFEKKLVVYYAAAIIMVLVSVSGIVSIVYSNDSMYYYSAYPHEIVRSGYLLFQFDTFLTDAGQATAIINTIPFLFGFNEAFGIQCFFNINFIMLFAYIIFEQASEQFEKKIAIGFSMIFTLLLITSMPFVFISKWIISNMYFMELIFIIVFMNKRFIDDNTSIYVRMILMMALSFMRIEGAIFVGLVVLSYLWQDRTKKRDVALLVLPATVLQAMYFIRIFVLMELHTTYMFMTKEKAIIAVAFLIVVLVYGLVYCDNSVLPVVKAKGKFLAPIPLTVCGLVLVNIALFAYDRSKFIAQAKVFLGNLLKQSGWGYFVAVVFILILLMPKVKIGDIYYELFCLGFVMLAFAACFARGGDMRVDLFDSSNRVLLQIVPLVIYTLAHRYIKSYSKTNG